MGHNRQQRIIATNIATDLFNKVIEFLRNNGWELLAAYNDQLYDKGTDFDCYQFIKDSSEILLAWDNWNGGEMQVSKEIINEIAQKTNISFRFGHPEHLHQDDFMDKMHPLLTYY